MVGRSEVMKLSADRVRRVEEGKLEGLRNSVEVAVRAIAEGTRRKVRRRRKTHGFLD